MLKRTLKDSIRGLDRVSLVEKWPFWASFQSIMSQIFDPSNPLFPRDTAFGQTMGTHRSQISTEAFFSRISFTDGISPLSLPLGGNEAFKRKIFTGTINCRQRWKLIGTDAFLSVICLTNEYLYLYLHLHLGICLRDIMMRVVFVPSPLLWALQCINNPRQYWCLPWARINFGPCQTFRNFRPF